MFFILPKKTELQLDLMSSSIDYIKVDVDDETITVYFKSWEGENFPEINDNKLIINVQISEYTGTIEELVGYKIRLCFSSIQVIKLLTDSNSYFLESVTTLNLIEVNYEIMDMVGDGSGQFYTDNFKVYLTNCLLINCLFEGEQLKPIESSNLFDYDDDDDDRLYIKLNKCLNISNENESKIYTGDMKFVNCYYYHNGIQLVISGDIPPELSQSRRVVLYENTHIDILSINKPPVSNITNLPIPINTTGDNASSIDLSGITF